MEASFLARILLKALGGVVVRGEIPKVPAVIASGVEVVVHPGVHEGIKGSLRVVNASIQGLVLGYDIVFGGGLALLARLFK